MNPRLYAARREEDLPFALVGLVLSLIVAFDRFLPYSMPELAIILIVILIFMRVLARQTTVLVQVGMWTIKRPLRPLLLYHETELASIEVIRKGRFGKRIRLLFHRNDELQPVDLHMGSFDPVQFLSDIQAVYPEKLDESAQEFLALNTVSHPSRITGWFALLGASILGFDLLLLHWLPYTTSRPQAHGIQVFNNLAPLLSCALAMLSMYVRFFRARWSRPSEAWSTAAILILLFVTYPVVQAWSGVIARPHIVEASIAALCLVLIGAGIHSLFFPGWRGAAVVYLLAALSFAGGRHYVLSVPFQLSGTFGRLDGNLLDFGWWDGEHPFLYSIESPAIDTLIATRYSASGETLDSIRFALPKKEHSYLMQYRMGKLHPLCNGDWVETGGDYLAIRSSGKDIPDTLWRKSGDVLGKPIELDQAMVSPNADRFVWKPPSREGILFGRLETLETDSLPGTAWKIDTLQLEEHESVLGILGWLSNDKLTYTTSVSKAFERSYVSLNEGTMNLEVSPPVIQPTELYRDERITWHDMSLSQYGVVFSGVGLDSNDNHIPYILYPGKSPEIIRPDEQSASASPWVAFDTQWISETETYLLINEQNREDSKYHICVHSQGSLEKVYTLKQGIPIDVSINNGKIFLLIRKLYRYEWLVLGKDAHGQWKVDFTAWTFALYNNLSIGTTTMQGNRIFADNHMHFILPYKTMPDLTEESDFAIWRIK